MLVKSTSVVSVTMLGNQVSRKKEGQKIYAGLNFWSVTYSLTYDIYLIHLYGGLDKRLEQPRVLQHTIIQQ